MAAPKAAATPTTISSEPSETGSSGPKIFPGVQELLDGVGDAARGVGVAARGVGEAAGSGAKLVIVGVGDVAESSISGVKDGLQKVGDATGSTVKHLRRSLQGKGHEIKVVRAIESKHKASTQLVKDAKAATSAVSVSTRRLLRRQTTRSFQLPRPELLRAVPSGSLLWHDVLMTNQGTAADFMLSAPANHIGTFISHNWHADAWTKRLALAFFFNASFASLTSLAVACLVGLASWQSQWRLPAPLDTGWMPATDCLHGQWHHVACSWATSEGTVVVAHFGWMPLFMPLVVVLLLVLGTRLPPQLVRYTPLPSPHPCP